MPFCWGFSSSFWKSSSVMVIVQSAGPVPGLHAGPEELTSTFHSPPVGPVMFIWYFAPIVLASSAFFERAAGSSSLNSFLMSTAIGVASSGERGVNRDSASSSSCCDADLLAGDPVSPGRFGGIETRVREPHQPVRGTLLLAELRDRGVARTDRQAKDG